MQINIRLYNGKRLDLEGKIIERRRIFGRDEGLFSGKLVQPIWVRLNDDENKQGSDSSKTEQSGKQSS